MNPWDRMNRDPQMAVNTSNALNQLLDQRQAQAEQQRQIADQVAGMGLQTDLSPLLALADQWTGGKSAQAYQKPETGQERLANVSALRQLASKNEEDVINAKLKQYLGNDRNDVALLARALTADKGEEQNQAKMGKDIDKVAKEFEGNKLVQKMRDRNLSFDQIDELIGQAEDGNTLSLPALGISMAKAMGEVGVMTDSDVVKYITSKQLSRQAGDVWSKWTTGVPAKPSLEEAREISQAIKRSMGRKFKPIVDRYSRRLQVNYGVPKEDTLGHLGLSPRLFDEESGKKEEKKTTSGANTAPPKKARDISPGEIELISKRDNLTVDQVKAALKARGHGFTKE